MNPAAEAVLKVDTRFETQPCNIPGWFHYSSRWVRATREVYCLKDPLTHRARRGAGGIVPCDNWPRIYAVIASRIGGKPGALLDIPSIFSDMENMMDVCATCRANLDHWAGRARLEAVDVKPLSFYAGL